MEYANQMVWIITVLIIEGVKKKKEKRCDVLHMA